MVDFILSVYYHNDMTTRNFKDHTCKAAGCTKLAEKDSYGLYKTYCSDACNPRKKDRTCKAKGCNNTQRKNHFGNYNNYCSDECSAKSFKSKIKTTYQTKSKEEKLATNELRKETVKEIYGVDNVSRAQSVKDTIRASHIEKYGNWYFATDEGRKAIADSYHNKTDEEKANIISTRIETNKELFGYEYAMENPDIAIKTSNALRDKTPEEWAARQVLQNTTKYKRYGNKTFNNRPKYVATCLRVFGVRNPSQNAIIHAKQFKNSHVPFTFPSGRRVTIQGYEDRAINELLNIFSEDDIFVSKSDMPEIWYMKDNIERRYYPDIYIPKNNLIIEVKCNWTWDGKDDILNTNLLKKEACISLGYNYLLMKYNNAGTKLLTEIIW